MPIRQNHQFSGGGERNHTAEPVTMASSKILFLASLLFSIVLHATAQCPEDSLDITVVGTGQMVAGKSEWKVTLTNICACTQSGLVLNCPDFSTAERIDPTIIRQVNNGHCLVRDGQPVYGEETVTFKYAAENQTHLSYSSSTISCS